VDGDDVAAGGQQRLVDGQEVADRRLRRGRQLARAAQALVEGVEGAHLRLALLRVGPVDVERHLVDVVGLHQRARQVVRCVGDDGDPGHAADPTSAG